MSATGTTGPRPEVPAPRLCMKSLSSSMGRTAGSKEPARRGRGSLRCCKFSLSAGLAIGAGQLRSLCSYGILSAMHSDHAKRAQAYLAHLCELLDRKQKLPRSRRDWWTSAFAVPAAVGLTLSAGACGGKVEVPPAGGGAAEVCDNGADDDGDNAIDCADSDCAASAACADGGTAEVCTNGIDDDGDGFVDCLDSSCAENPACTDGGTLDGAVVEVCNDNLDNDGDNAIDCVDSDCYASPYCSMPPYGAPIELCTDGVDNDGDTLVDCSDSDCAADPVCGLPVYAAAFKSP